MVEYPPKKQLSIKIKAQEPSAAPKPEQAPAYVYHWDRIIGAFLALAVLIGLVGFGLYSWLAPPVPTSGSAVEQARSQDETAEATAGRVSGADDKAMPDTALASGAEPTQPLEQTTPDMTTVPQPAQIGASIPEQDSASRVPAVDPATSAQNPVQTPKQTPEQPPEQIRAPIDSQTGRIAIAGLADARSPAADDPIPIAADETIRLPQPVDPDGPDMEESRAPPTVEAPPAVDASESGAGVAPDRPSDVDTGQTSAPPVAAQPKSESEPDPQPELPPEPAKPEDPQTAQASPALVRFQLAQSVVGNEPRGDLAAIRANAKGPARVSAFSEVTGLQGDVLHYRWLHEGKEVLRVRVPVRANRWRSHSEKRIGPGMEGAWRVELLDSKGTLIGNIDFVY